jgi:hypothetical protein
MGILLTGKISSENITSKILNKIEIKDKVNTSHKWIENIKDKELYNNINKLKKSFDIKKELIKLYPNKKCKIINVKEMDEIYISIPPKKINNYIDGNKTLFMRHIDCISPFMNVYVYRIIIQLTPKTNIITCFPNKTKAIQLDKNMFVGFDFNHEEHYVSGHLESGEHRILLKFHFIISPINFSKKYLEIVYAYNKHYEYLLRNITNYSTNPTTISKIFSTNIQIYTTMLRLQLKNICLILIIILISYKVGKNSIVFKI